MKKNLKGIDKGEWEKLNKIDLLKELEGNLYHNLLCYSENYLMNKPKKILLKKGKKQEKK